MVRSIEPGALYPYKFLMITRCEADAVAGAYRALDLWFPCSWLDCEAHYCTGGLSKLFCFFFGVRVLKRKFYFSTEKKYKNLIAIGRMPVSDVGCAISQGEN